MFSLLNKQHRRQASGEHKQAPHNDEQPHTTTNNKPTKRKTRSAANTSGSTLTSHSSTSLAPLPSASTYIAEHPQRVARINFHRLLSRVEKQIQAANTVGEEHKKALNSVREQTLSLESLRSQLECIQGDLDSATLTSYVHRLSQLWTAAHIDPQHIAQTQLQRMHAASSNDTTPVSLPPLPILSSSSLHPSHPTRPISSIAQSASSAHPVADASHFTAQHTRPSRATTAQLRSQLFQHSQPAPPATASTSASHPDDLTSEQERGLEALSELAPQLKAQVRAIAAHLKVDETVVADTSGMLEANVLSVRRENVRLKAWARASCGETCQLSGMIVFVLLMFALMLLMMKIIPAPRS